ncbi:MAG: PfkB family carbohydrate kinase, partial [Patescibacteria group bacterium]
TLLLYKGGERTILVYRGVANELDAKKIPWSKLKSKWIYVSALGGRTDLLKKILSVAKSKKIKIAWNPGGAELSFGFLKLLPCFQKADVLNINREEAAKLFNLPFDNLAEILRRAKELPCKYTIITDGIRGAYVCCSGQVFHANSYGGKPKNTTGAGDAFGSGFVSGLILGRDVKDALRLGIWNSGLVVKHMGAKAGIWKRLPAEKDLNKVKVTLK